MKRLSEASATLPQFFARRVAVDTKQGILMLRERRVGVVEGCNAFFV